MSLKQYFEACHALNNQRSWGTRMKSLLVALLLSAGLIAVTPSVLAKTPDGKTPAEESVCDPLKADDITKGLYGLCVAFCEAQDHADIADPITEEGLIALAESAPSGRILENYNKKKTDEDPSMPCVLAQDDVTCPCWTAAELASIDYFSPDGSPARTNCEIYYEPAEWTSRPYGQIYEKPLLDNSTINLAIGQPNLCRYYNDQELPVIDRTIGFTQEEREQGLGMQCFEEVLAQAELTSCEPP